MENGTNMKFSYLRVRDDTIIWKNAVMKLHFKRLKILKKELKPKWKNMAMNNNNNKKKQVDLKKSQIVWLEMKIKILEIKNVAPVK